ncbi:spore coat protein [Alkalihalophilus marmarensis]|uniref:Spore coat protein n=1 Tax=Alkalihalophilus marmarensis DSM 21297 TaxID=1188261 RepID=U6SP04_9BACI|nr:spore coat protein [Alkalihalophilus marmarensis]ERN53122.1 spore coat protein [Alkalihalophilus marmarensis DSM 21297]MCM3488934.1 spore coat protein [Alkalihalophilus marmarensis]
MKRIYVYNGEAAAAQANNRWSALDAASNHRICDANDIDNQENVEQGAAQTNKTLQLSEEYIVIKDSTDVNVISTDVKAALSLQASLQAAIAIVVRLAFDNGETAELVTQDLLQTAKLKQLSYQKTVIENSHNVDVTTTDTQVTANIQLLVQLLIALLVNLDL